MALAALAVLQVTCGGAGPPVGGESLSEQEARRDRRAPEVFISSPLPGANVSGTLAVSGTARDDLRVTKVELSVDDGPFALATGTSSWSFPVDTTALANGAHSAMARATDGVEKVGSASVVFEVQNGQVTPGVLVAAGAAWRYLDDGSSPAGWAGGTFDDSGWKEGRAQLGYGDGDEQTLVGYGADPANKFITTYFRRRFVVPDASAIAGLRLRLLRDDGAVVFLNGSEVLRVNLPAGEVSSTTLATSSSDWTTWDEATVSAALLHDGENVLAVEVHQANATSSDLSFDAELLVATGGGGEADPVLVGAGDIARCDLSNDEATANLLDGIPGTVFTAGDNVYSDGTASEFSGCYAPSWGRHKARTRPSPGNHDYHTAGASPYFSYFGDSAGEPGKGYYSYDLGDWHIVVLNSNCSAVGGCSAGSAQEQWLRADLAANPKPCTLAYWHHPLFSSGYHGNNTFMAPLWKALYDHNAELVIAGHDHNYERFAPMTSTGAHDAARGLRSFVVGTGGTSLRAMGTTKANSEVRNSTTHGVLKLTLHPAGFSWSFVPVAGKAFTDSGTGECH